MRDRILEALSTSPDLVVTFLLSMLPIFELRGSIPYAIAVGVLWQQAFVISVVGNFLAIVPVVYLLGPISEWLRRWKTSPGCSKQNPR